jgi:hypothetical protein
MKKAVLFSFLIAIYGCSNANKERIIPKNMPIVEELKANKIAIKEVLNPVDMIMLDDYFVFQNEYHNGEDCFLCILPLICIFVTVSVV